MTRIKSCLAALTFVLLATPTWALAQTTAEKAPPAEAGQDVRQVGFPGLVEGLKTSPGCLGIESAQTASGKNVLFAWFKDKDAVLQWYYSDTHQELMNKFFPGRENRDPLEDVPDGTGPIMAIASITMSDKPHFEGSPLPISQIAIELYAPVTGGISLGGRFAPQNVKVENLRSYDEKTASDR